MTTIANAHNNLQLSNVSKRFPLGGKTRGFRDVLSTINLDIQAGEFVSIVGASGCGKSTLLRLIVGLEQEFDGVIRLDDRPIKGPGLERGIVFQDHRLFPWLNVEDNISLALTHRRLDAHEKHALIQQHIDLVGLQGFEKSFPSQISGGMAQRVAIARGLVNRPEVLLLDEPLGALDALTRTRLQGEIERIWQQENITMLLVTHDVEEAVYLSDRVVVMAPNPGRIKRIVEVDLPRPRSRSDSRFIALRDNLLSDFS